MKTKLSLTLLFTLLLPSIAFAGEKPYSDIYHNHFEAIYWTKEWGIFEGYPDGSFKPENEISRADLTKALVLSVLTEDEVASCAEGTEWTFTDVPTDEWYTDYVYCAKAKGWISGDDGKNTLRPGDPALMGETFKAIVESQYGTPDASYEGDQWYDRYYNFLVDYQIIEEESGFYMYTYFYNIGMESYTISGEHVHNHPGAKMERQDIAQLLYRSKIAFKENQAEPYDLFYTFEEIEELYGTEFELGETLSVADSHFGFRFEDLPLEHLDVDPDDWRIYLQDTSGFENGYETLWYLYYPADEGYTYADYRPYFHVSISDSGVYTDILEEIGYDYGFDNENGQQYFWWCDSYSPGCTVDGESVNAESVGFSAY